MIIQVLSFIGNVIVALAPWLAASAVVSLVIAQIFSQR